MTCPSGFSKAVPAAVEGFKKLLSSGKDDKEDTEDKPAQNKGDKEEGGEDNDEDEDGQKQDKSKDKSKDKSEDKEEDSEKEGSFLQQWQQMQLAPYNYENNRSEVITNLSMQC